MSRTGTKVLGWVVAVAVLGAGCSGDDTSGSAPPTTVSYDVAEGLGSPASTLRAELTTLLQEHAFLVTITTGTRLAGTDPAPAGAVLDQNSTDLAAGMTRFYGETTGSRFLDAWRRHAAGLVAFTDVAASPDKAVVAAAKAGLTAVQAEITEVLNTANVQLTPDALTDALSAYAGRVQAAVTAQAKKDGTAAAKVKEAAGGMKDLAIVLAAGTVKQKKDDVPGSLDAIGAVMRTSLSAELQEHAYLAGILTAAMLGGGDTKGAGEVLDENSVELSRAIAAVYGEETGDGFLDLWRRHVGLLGEYARAAAANDRAGMQAARSGLDGYRSDVGALLAGVNPKLTKAAVADDLGRHIDGLLAVVGAQAAKDPTQVAKLREAARQMPATGLRLATGIAQQFPGKFG